MQNPFAVAMQWPNEPRRYVVHLSRPYFSAAMVETASALWLLVSWAPGHPASAIEERASVFRAAARFCREQLDQIHVPIEFIERKHGHQLPRFLMAQSADTGLYIVEPEHPAPLVEVRESDAGSTSKTPKLSQRFDVVTQWRLEQMRNYYQQFLERQQKTVVAPSSSLA